jgi:hypothetical protein
MYSLVQKRSVKNASDEDNFFEHLDGLLFLIQYEALSEHYR